MKNHSLPETNFKAKQLQGICMARCDALQDSLHVGTEGSIVCEEKVPDQHLLNLGEGLEAKRLPS